MATIREYVEGKLARVGLDIGNVELTVALDTQEVDDLTPCDTSDALATAKRIIVGVIPELLLLPDVTEGGMSIKRDRAAIAKYYGLLCSELGIVNRLDAPAESPTVSDRSYLW